MNLVSSAAHFVLISVVEYSERILIFSLCVDVCLVLIYNMLEIFIACCCPLYLIIVIIHGNGSFFVDLHSVHTASMLHQIDRYSIDIQRDIDFDHFSVLYML